jgi:hypothetical protein
MILVGVFVGMCLTVGFTTAWVVWRLMQQKGGDDGIMRLTREEFTRIWTGEGTANPNADRTLAECKGDRADERGRRT